MIKLDSVSEQTKLKPCPFCGSEIKHKVKMLHFFECPNCGAVVSFTGKKKIMPGVYEAAEPIKNWNRRTENE